MTIFPAAWLVGGGIQPPGCNCSFVFDKSMVEVGGLLTTHLIVCQLVVRVLLDVLLMYFYLNIYFLLFFCWCFTDAAASPDLCNEFL